MDPALESREGKRKREEEPDDAADSGVADGAVGPAATVAAASAAADPGGSLPADELAALLEELSGVTPTIPTAAIHFYLMKNGFNTTDERVIKMVAMATQKFVADIATDALQHCKQRLAGQPASRRASTKDKRFVLTSTDLQAALKEQGIGVAKPPYYV
mmetsp:Transcript_9813/g.25179  ORF Transcript_9813/g.25179 Transcript_9813/m.25179 type:complete len:159 (+) Transcript_9813:186-662(+)